eukprot:1615321-Pleurochrysis_carterae.AAC.2
MREAWRQRGAACICCEKAVFAVARAAGIRREGGLTHTPRTCPSRPHSLRNAAGSVACDSVRWIRFKALKALLRGRKSTPAAATKTTQSQRPEVPAWLFSGMAMVSVEGEHQHGRAPESPRCACAQRGRACSDPIGME